MFTYAGSIYAGTVTTAGTPENDWVMIVHTPSDRVGFGVDVDDESSWTIIPN
jgi:hypothetical protein